MEVSAESIKELREKTGAGIMDCKKALLEAGGDLTRAALILKEQGLEIAEKKAEREARQGLIEAYVHAGGRIGAMVEINCETDFVAHTDEFKELAHNLAMQVAAMSPKFVSPEDAPEGVDPKECLLFQPFIKDPQKTIQDIVTEVMMRLRENIKVKRFARFELGD